MTPEPVRRPARLALVGAAFLFLLLRLRALDAWPLFIDEAQHLHWMRRLWAWPPFLRPLTDGKALQIVVGALVVPFVSDPVLAGRVLSVAAGAVSLWCAFRMADLLGGHRAGVLAAFLHAVVPFAVVHERLALADPFLAAAASCVLLQTIRLMGPSSQGAGALGAGLGAAVLAKVPGLMFFAVPVVGAAFARDARRRLLIGIVLGALVALLPAVYFFTSTAQLEEKLEGPDEAVATQGLLLENAGHAAGWFGTYLTPGIALLALGGLASAVVRGTLRTRLVALAAVLPVLAFVGAFYWFPRYVLPSVVPLVVLAALALAELTAQRRWMVPAALLVVVAAPAVWFDVLAVREPSRVLPEVDVFQYVSGWPSGAAGDAAWRRIEGDVGERNALVVVDATGHGTIHYVLRTRFMNKPRVEVLVSALDDARGLLETERHRRAVFVVVTTRRRGVPRPFPPAGLAATFLQDLVRRDGALAGRLYRLDPP